MRPLAVVNGIILGTCLSIAVSLGAVLCMFVLLGDDYPRLDYEFGALTTSLAIFVGMTAISGLSFYGILRKHPARALAQGALWAGIAATAYYYWP